MRSLRSAPRRLCRLTRQSGGAALKFEVPPDFFPMNERDLDEVVQLEAEVQDFPWQHEHFRDSLQAGYSCWICNFGGELAGFSVVMQVLDEAHLLNFAVSARRQGHGLGGRLLQKSMEVARQNGATEMFLEVRASNCRAADLYRNFGFRQIATRQAYYPAANGREDALIFKKELL